MPTREEMRSLAEDIVGCYADRVAGIAQLRETAKMDLKGFQDSRTAMGREVRVDLARDTANRKHEVGVILDGFGQALAIIGREMTADLAKGVADRKREVGHMLRGFSAELKDIGSELGGARDEWQKMTATMQSKRGGVAVAVKPPIEELSERMAALREQVFEYLANHPDGTKMTELEQEFGLARIQMAKLLKNLMAEKKVRKRELLYLAI